MKDKSMAVLGIGTAQALGFFFYLLKSLNSVNQTGILTGTAQGRISWA
jgi:hypothetical protein